MSKKAVNALVIYSIDLFRVNKQRARTIRNCLINRAVFTIVSENAGFLYTLATLNNVGSLFFLNIGTFYEIPDISKKYSVIGK